MVFAARIVGKVRQDVACNVLDVCASEESLWFILEGGKPSGRGGGVEVADKSCGMGNGGVWNNDGVYP